MVYCEELGVNYEKELCEISQEVEASESSSLYVGSKFTYELRSSPINVEFRYLGINANFNSTIEFVIPQSEQYKADFYRFHKC